MFTSTPSVHRILGYPLESIQIDPATGVCLADMPPDVLDDFHVRSIGKPLQDFVKKVQF
ncbi:MAG: hypothetical protein HYW65_02435 [Candidatus Liptonbacteria bacterium]|nr:hypothetical protein [Candidatus Liptonbacteria bacterium]